MGQVYVRTDPGPPPVTVTEAKDHLRLHSDADDEILTQLLHTATEAVEAYTRRDVRANTYNLLLDEFEDRICVRRDLVDAITSVSYTVSSSPVVVSSSVYYLRRDVQSSEILLQEDQVWPTDGDIREQGITIVFTTTTPAYLVEVAKSAVLRIVAHLYENRGDVDPVSSGMSVTRSDIVRKSGAGAILDQFRISRV